MYFLRKILKIVHFICQNQEKAVPLRRKLENMRFDKEDLQAALRVLREGGIIVYPTDTVWGIGCDATNAEAVKRIYALKQREDSKSMLVLLDSPAKLNYYIADIPDTAWAFVSPTKLSVKHYVNNCGILSFQQAPTSAVNMRHSVTLR